MKILILNGSPKVKKSSTMYLTQAFLDGAGYINAEIIDVSRLEIKSCAGCYACWSKTPGKCVFRDDMDEILEKWIEADIVVWSFPLYVFNVPGGLKNLIDRLLPTKLPGMAKNTESGGHPSRYDLTNKRHVFISTCGFWTTEGNYGSTIAMFDRYFYANERAYIFCAQGGLFGKPEAQSFVDSYLEIVKQAGSEFANGGISEATQAELAEPILPREVYESAADASWGIETTEVSGSNSSEPKTDDSLKFTKQMAAFYVPDGNERVLEMHYTDIGKTYQIVMTSKCSEVITSGFKKYTTKIETPYTVWRAISSGEISGQDALFQKKYKLLGDFDLMMKWDELFGGKKPNKKAVATAGLEPQRKTNMKVLLMPWIIIWIAISINPVVGGVLGVLSAVTVSLLWLKYRPVVYEHITVPMVAGISLAVILGIDIRIIIPISYFCFGMMWLISTFTKTPLTAHYSYNDYGGEEMLKNPIFMKVNRILTTCWGCLYLVMTVVMYFLMGTALLRFTGILSSAPPVLMGIFTAWFPGWYMARWVRGD